MIQKNLHIIIIGPANPLRGGISAFNERLANAFQDNGHKVTIYTFSLQYPGFLFPGTTQLSDEAAPEGLNIKVSINSINPFNWIKIGTRIKKERPDIIVVRYWLPFMGPCLGTILRIANKNKHCKVICIADNVIPHEKRPGDHAFTKYFVKPVDAFITMSQKVMEDLKKFKITKPKKYVPHPLYDNFGEKVSKKEAREKLNINNEELIVLFFGFIRKYKGLDILLDAMKILKASSLSSNSDLPSPKLLIAGEFYDDSKPYDEQIKRLGIHDSLILRTGFIPNNEVKYYLCAADVVVQPYRNATQSGVTPLAYHFEVPMIVTNVGGLPALVPDGKVGLIAEPTAESIAAKITEYFQKGELFFLPNLKEEKKKYSWDLMVSEIIQLGDSKI
jgi:glycosyltransferase involved in cell wall biosynthesis